MIKVVIGANFGDEGKGLVVDYLSRAKGLTVRFNGGAQAGHGVQQPDGTQHDFRHVGAGTFDRADTLLTQDFIVNPILFLPEYKQLAAWKPVVFIDRHARITTPWDMLLNQGVEIMRGADRHGSCGVGINETVTRCEDLRYTLTVGMLDDAHLLEDRLAAIEQEYVPRRAEQLSVLLLPFALTWRGLFLEQLQTFRQQIVLADSTTILRQYERAAERIVFEGAQGLRLDEVNGTYPHVTRSRTGLTNVVRLLYDAGLQEKNIRVFYVTRSYLTRHGAGPLPNECVGHPFGWAGPESNVTGEFQGALRYATLDVSELARVIHADLAQAAHLHIEPVLAMTCLDQVPEESGQALLQQARAACGFERSLRCYGPTADTVVDIRSHADSRVNCGAF